MSLCQRIHTAQNFKPGHVPRPHKMALLSLRLVLFSYFEKLHDNILYFCSILIRYGMTSHIDKLLKFDEANISNIIISLNEA